MYNTLNMPLSFLEQYILFKTSWSIFSFSNVFALLATIPTHPCSSLINLIYSFLGEHPIVQNTDISDSIESWNFDNDDIDDEYTYSFYYFNIHIFENYIDPSDDYDHYILRLQEFG